MANLLRRCCTAIIVTIANDQFYRGGDFRGLAKQSAKFFRTRFMLCKGALFSFVYKDQVNVRNKFSIAKYLFFRTEFTACPSVALRGCQRKLSDVNARKKGAKFRIGCS